MSNKLFKKVIAAASATAVTLSVIAPVTSASAYSVESANALAANGVINDRSSNPAAYNLDSEITRQEIAKVIVNLSGEPVNEGCEGKFADVSGTGVDAWACPYIETALENGFISANANFNPTRNVSKWESMKLVLNATGYGKAEGYALEQEAYVMSAVQHGLISEAFTDYDTPAKRGFIFDAAAGTLEVEEEVVEEDDILGSLGDLLGGDTDEETTMDNEETTTEEDNASVITIDEDVLQVELSPMSPENGERAPIGTPRVTMMVLDVTAGTDDVELKTIKLVAAGFGDSADIDDVVLYDQDGEKVTRQRSVNSDDEVELDFINEFTVKAGETVSLTVAAQIDSNASNGDVFALNVAEIEATSDVDGASIEGPELEAVSISSQGELVVKANEATSDVTVGEEAKLAGLKVKNDNDKENILLKTIRLQQTGSVDEDYITGMYVTIDGDEVVSDLEFAKEYITINFGEGFELPKARSSYYNIELFGTITGEPTKTVAFEVEDADDIYAVGAKLGYNTPVKDTADNDFSGGLSVSDTLTIEGSAIEVSFEKSTKDSSNVDVDDFNFGSLKFVSTTSDYTLENYTITLTVTRADDDVLTTDLLENIKLGGLSTDSTLTDAALTSTTDGAESITFDVVFEDITLRKGESKVLPLTADIPKNVEKDQVSYEFDLSFVDNKFTLKDEDNNETYDEVAEIRDILSTYSGLDTRTIDVEGANLEITVEKVSNEDIVLGDYTATVFSGHIEAGSAADVKLNEIVFTNTATNAVDDLEDVVAKGILTIGDEVIESTDIDATTITFDSLSEVIKAGSSNKTEITLDVKFKKADDTAIDGGDDEVSLTLSAANIEAEDNEVGTELAVADLTIETSASNTATLATKGAIEVEIDDSEDDANVDQFDKSRFVVAGTKNYKLAKIDLEADKERVQVKELVFLDDTADQDAKDSITNLRLMDGSRVIANGTTTLDGTDLTVTFDDIDSFYVDTEKETYYLVADIKAINLDADFVDSSAKSGANFDFEIDSYEFEGESSSEELTQAAGDVTETDLTANTVTVVASDVASIELSKVNATPIEGQFVTVATMVVNPSSNSNLDAAGDQINAILESIAFASGDVVASGLTGAGITYTVLVEEDGNDVTTTAGAGVDITAGATVPMDITDTDAEIDGRTEFTIKVKVDNTTAIDADSYFTIEFDRETVDFDDGAGATTIFNKLYKSGATVNL